jgi:hypothetical protein
MFARRFVLFFSCLFLAFALKPTRKKQVRFQSSLKMATAERPQVCSRAEIDAAVDGVLEENKRTTLEVLDYAEELANASHLTQNEYLQYADQQKQYYVFLDGSYSRALWRRYVVVERALCQRMTVAAGFETWMALFPEDALQFPQLLLRSKT